MPESPLETTEELPESHLCQLAQVFLENLSRLQKEVILSTKQDYLGDAIALQKQAMQLQQQFQKIVAAIAITPLDVATEQRLRPYQTEAHRLLRLAGVAAMKLKAAKQPETLTKGRSQLTAQLTQLQPFAQAIADEVCGSFND
ncbi:MAG: hypothetical protein WBA76_22490 [Phormidesmis sp.]